MFAYADDLTVMVPSHGHIKLVGETLKEYEIVAVAKSNSEISVGLQLGPYRSRPISSNSVLIMGH